MIRKMLTRAALGACAMLGATSAQAQDFYYGQIITVGFNYCPDGTLDANGAAVSTSVHPALYALYGTRYGNPGTGYFNLPDLRDKVQIGWSNSHAMGATGGQSTVTLTTSQLPSHTHTATLNASTSAPSTGTPTSNAFATFPSGQIYTTGSPSSPMNAATVAVGNTGSGTAVPVLDPYLTLRYCIVANGIWPPMP